MEPPVPPSVNDGRITSGKPSWSQRRKASCALFTNADAGTSRPILRQASLNHSRSSATLMARSDAPIISTLYFSRIPPSLNSTARFSAVCPPTLGNNFLEVFLGQRLDVSAIGQLWIGHDRGRIRVDQDDFVALRPQRLASLR